MLQQKYKKQIEERKIIERKIVFWLGRYRLARLLGGWARVSDKKSEIHHWDYYLTIADYWTHRLAQITNFYGENK
jgi:hypothetical protein